MAYAPSILPQDQTAVGSATVAATTAGTSIIVASASTGAIYVTGVFVSAGTASTVSLGYGVAAVAPTTTAILIQPVYLAATGSAYYGLLQPVKVPALNNALVTFVGGSVAYAGVTYYVAP